MTTFPWSQRTEPRTRATGNSFRCVACKGKTRVADSRPTELGVRRRRVCEACAHNFTTFEIAREDAEEAQGALDTHTRPRVVALLTAISERLDRVLDEFQGTPK